jgi:hypothetical protein
MEQIAWIVGGFAIGYFTMKAASAFINWAEKQEKK